MRRAALPLFIAALVVAAACIVGTSAGLPNRVVSHFGADGKPNGWMDRDAYVHFMLAFAVLLPIGVAALLALIPRAIPRRANIPNRDYWLAEPRRKETQATLAAFGCMLAAALTLFLAAVHLLVVKANAASPVQMPGGLFVTILVIFFAALILWALALHGRFRLPR